MSEDVRKHLKNSNFMSPRACCEEAVDITLEVRGPSGGKNLEEQGQ